MSGCFHNKPMEFELKIGVWILCALGDECCYMYVLYMYISASGFSVKRCKVWMGLCGSFKRTVITTFPAEQSSFSIFLSLLHYSFIFHCSHTMKGKQGTQNYKRNAWLKTKTRLQGIWACYSLYTSNPLYHTSVIRSKKVTPRVLLISGLECISIICYK